MGSIPFSPVIPSLFLFLYMLVFNKKASINTKRFSLLKKYGFFFYSLNILQGHLKFISDFSLFLKMNFSKIFDFLLLTSTSFDAFLKFPFLLFSLYTKRRMFVYGFKFNYNIISYPFYSQLLVFVSKVRRFSKNLSVLKSNSKFYLKSCFNSFFSLKINFLKKIFMLLKVFYYSKLF